MPVTSLTSPQGNGSVVVRSTEHTDLLQTWVVTSFAYVESILKDPRFVVDHLPARLAAKAADYHEDSFLQLSHLLENWINFLNPPDHSRLKKAISIGRIDVLDSRHGKNWQHQLYCCWNLIAVAQSC